MSRSPRKAWSRKRSSPAPFSRREGGRGGGRKRPTIACDIRFEEQVALAVEATVRQFGGIDILVNNASAIDLRGI